MKHEAIVANHREALRKNIALTLIQVPAELLQKSNEDDLEKGGEGSRGGKVIGHTKSGKPIYDDAEHPDHKNFTSEEHLRAANVNKFKAKHEGDAEGSYLKAAKKHEQLAKEKEGGASESKGGETFNSSDKKGKKLYDEYLSAEKELKNKLKEAKNSSFSEVQGSEEYKKMKNAEAAYKEHIHSTEHNKIKDLESLKNFKKEHASQMSNRELSYTKGALLHNQSIEQSKNGKNLDHMSDIYKHLHRVNNIISRELDKRNEAGDKGLKNKVSSLNTIGTDKESATSHKYLHQDTIEKSNEDDLEKGGVGSGRHKIGDKVNVSLNPKWKHRGTISSDMDEEGNYKVKFHTKEDREAMGGKEKTIHSNNISKCNDIEKSVEYFTAENILKFSEDLQKAFDSGEVNQKEFEKAVKDLTKLQKKIITNKDGFQQTVYVRQHEDGTEHHFKTGDKVKFHHEGKERSGIIMKLKHHEKYDKFGTAEIHDHNDKDASGKPKVYSKSLRAVEHHGTSENKIGTTDSYKNVYANFDHPLHEKFTKNDHLEAADFHEDEIKSARKNLETTPQGYPGRKESADLYDFHSKQKSLHKEAATKDEKGEFTPEEKAKNQKVKDTFAGKNELKEEVSIDSVDPNKINQLIKNFRKKFVKNKELSSSKTIFKEFGLKFDEEKENEGYDLSDKYPDMFKDRTFKALPVKKIKLKDIIISQPDIDLNNINYKDENSINEPISLSRRIDGKIVLEDGNHRALLNLLLGKKEINAHVLDVKKYIEKAKNQKAKDTFAGKDEPKKETSISKLGIKLADGIVSIHGKKVEVDRNNGSVFLEGKGNHTKMTPGAFYPAGSSNNQLQGITYVHVFNKFKKLIEEGKTWEEVNEFMGKTKGPIHGEKLGETWNEIKNYLGVPAGKNEPKSKAEKSEDDFDEELIQMDKAQKPERHETVEQQISREKKNKVKKSFEYVVTEEQLIEKANDLQKALDNADISNEYFEKAVKDLTQLQKKIIINKDGHQQTVYVRIHDDQTEHHFTHGDSVKFEHHGKSLTGTIKGLKSHEKYDKFGTAEIHDSQGNKYSKSLRQIEHHVTPVEFDKTEGDESGNVNEGGEIERLTQNKKTRESAEIATYKKKLERYKENKAELPEGHKDHKFYDKRIKEVNETLKAYGTEPETKDTEAVNKEGWEEVKGGDVAIFDYKKVKDYEKWLTSEGIDYAPGDQLKTTSAIRGIPKGSIVQYVYEDKNTGKAVVKLHGVDQTVSLGQLNDKMKFYKDGEISEKRKASGKFDEYGNLKKLNKIETESGKIDKNVLDETSEGNKIYKNKGADHPVYSDFTAQEHLEAAKAHKMTGNKWSDIADKVVDRNQQEEAEENRDYHYQISDHHNKKSKELNEKGKGDSMAVVEQPKMSGVEAINYKQDQLKALEAKIKNHDTGVKKMEDDDLTNAKNKAKLLKLVIKNLATKSGIDLSKSNK